MARDSFFQTHAAELAANIGMATLKDMGPNLFSRIDCNSVGEVLAYMTNGVLLVLKWDVDSQSLKQVQRLEPTLVMEIAA